ncbi:MAG TPA: regulatory signaling modulator protein AmpE [Rhodanobacteraceae bacterium]|nr:regulatory signaling modulator protein AmpE [Rhodanobacteraceae bacterium]
MAIRLVAALIVLLLAFSQVDFTRVREFAWFRSWLVQLHFAEGGGRIAIALALPVVACALVQRALYGWGFGLAGVIFAVLVLIYTLGPREPEQDIDAVLTAADAPSREAAAQLLREDATAAPLPFTASALVEAAVLAGLRRRFGVLFWFFVIGPAGALLYRLAQIAAADNGALDLRARDAARRFAAALDWLPAHLMVLAMALVSDFEAVLHAWRAWHTQPGRSPWELEPGFLAAVARSGVDADIEAGDGGMVADTSDPLEELADARRLLVRVLVVWLAVVALIVLAGWIA